MMDLRGEEEQVLSTESRIVLIALCPSAVQHKQNLLAQFNNINVAKLKCYSLISYIYYCFRHSRPHKCKRVHAKHRACLHAYVSM